jgi:hypothetical protein
MNKNKKTRQAKAFEALAPDLQWSWMRSLYESALRIGSIRAVEDREKIGRNRLYRWVKKNKGTVPMPQMGPKKHRHG